MSWGNMAKKVVVFSEVDNASVMWPHLLSRWNFVLGGILYWKQTVQGPKIVSCCSLPRSYP